MKYLLIIPVLIMLTGCNSEKNKRYMMAIKACEKQNGVPMLNGYGRMTECKFNNSNISANKGIMK